ncbi:helix-turn-helix domain-containing protein [Roseicyclus amphidinii]|uniref:helix-turn-helix domain-containing protein n=1 Tax=Roseicyclus amphidinii TaxID=3034232 RepID=UPI0024E0B5E5|nr:helix-turn-helix transcriptional regulator [Roseicyclus sp. Amp-Y-6]
MNSAEFQQARQTLGLPAADLARMLGVSSERAVQTFSDWANGRRQIDQGRARLLRAYLDGYRPPDWP